MPATAKIEILSPTQSPRMARNWAVRSFSGAVQRATPRRGGAETREGEIARLTRNLSFEPRPISRRGANGQKTLRRPAAMWSRWSWSVTPMNRAPEGTVFSKAILLASVRTVFLPLISKGAVFTPVVSELTKDSSRERILGALESTVFAAKRLVRAFPHSIPGARSVGVQAECTPQARALGAPTPVGAATPTPSRAK